MNIWVSVWRDEFNFWFPCVSALVCFGVNSGERLRAPVLWVEEKHTVFSCFLFASSSCLGSVCSEAFSPAPTSSQREERTTESPWSTWTGSSGSRQGLEQVSPHFLAVQSHSHPELCQEGSCGWAAESRAGLQLGGGRLQPTSCTVLCLLGSSAQIPQREHTRPGFVFTLT